jgi:hypothetical protein
VADEAELRFLAGILAVEPRIRVGGRDVGGVRPLLAVEADIEVTSTAGRRLIAIATRRLVLRPEALHRRPRLDQCAVDREVIARQKPLHARLRQNRRQELRRNVAAKQPVAVGREARMIPCRIVDPDPDEPAEQEIVFEPLHQLTFRADRSRTPAGASPEATSPAAPMAARSAGRVPKGRVQASPAPH